MFERGEPRFAKYRLEAAQKSTSMWAEDGGEPDPEQVELSQRYAWEYIAKRGDFYIYRSFERGARELNTDPEVQALALDAVKKRRAGEAVQLLVWVVLYAACAVRGLLLTVIEVRTWLFLLTAGFVLWAVADSVSAFVHPLRCGSRSSRTASGAEAPSVPEQRPRGLFELLRRGFPIKCELHNAVPLEEQIAVQYVVAPVELVGAV